jgi:hypothetical protein
MPPNTKPIFPLVPNIGIARITAGNTATDGTGTVTTMFTAGTNGARLDKVTISSAGTNVATVLRLFLNNGSATSTAANNALVAEIDLPATTSSAVKANSPRFDVNLDIALPAGWKLTAVLATAVASGWAVSALGGDF